MKYSLVALKHWVNNGRGEWGEDWALHRQGCREAPANGRWYGVDFVIQCDSVEDAVYTCFGDFIGEDEEDMSLEEASLYLKKCPCTKEGALFCDQSKCKNCGTTIYDLENAVYVEWWSEDDCGCTRGKEVCE